MIRFVRSALAAMALALATQAGYAGTLNLTAPVSPNIYTGFVLNVNYTAEAGPISTPNFSVNNTSGSYQYIYDTSSDSYGIVLGDISITGDVTTGSAVVGPDTDNQVTISGHLIDGVHNALNLTLISGTLTHIGMQNGVPGNVVNALFDVTGGLLAPEFGPKGGIILTVYPETSDKSFSDSFTGTSSVADVFAVPTPTAVWGGLALTAGLMIVRSRKAANRA